VIQPYIGLQLGLRVILQRARNGDRHADAELERLLALVDAEVNRLRGYIAGLKEPGDAQNTLMPAIREFVSRFAQVTGIDVDVDGPSHLAVNDRIGAELFDITAEALSNIRRHTVAHRATVVVKRSDHAIAVRVENDGAGAMAPHFEPQSLQEHARALGGSLEVERSSGTTAIVINIPL
jgi:signal transduction histidine kinase